MPEGNPLVADAKQDPNGPGALTAGNGDYGWAGGIGIAESSMDAFNGIKDGDWVSGGLGVLSLAGEIAGAAVDPFGYLMSSVASFLMEHIQPLKDMLDSLAGNPPVIQSYADTWGNVSKALGERKTDFDNAVKTGTTGWTGTGADAYRKFATEHSDALSGAATVAGAISTVTMIMGQVVSFVRETVRQLIADLVGKLIAWVMEEVFSLGFGTPVVVAQASAAIAKWGKKIGELLKKLTDTIRRVSPLLSKLVDIFEKIAKVFGKVLGKVSGLDGLKIKEGGFVHKIPKGEGGGVHARAHGGDGDSSPDGSDGSHSGDGDSSSGDSGDSGGSHGDSDSPSSDPMNTDSSPDTDPGSRRSSSRDGSGSPDGDGSPSHAGDGDASASGGGDSSPSHAGDSSPSARTGDGSPSAARSGDSSPGHAGDSSPAHAGDSSPSARAGDSSPSHAGDSSPLARAGDSSPSHAGDSSPAPTRAGDSSPSHAGDSSPSARAGDGSPSPTRAGDNSPSHAGDSSPSARAADSSPAPTHSGSPSHADGGSPSHADGGSPTHSGSSPAARSDAPGPHGGTETPSSAAPPRADGTTSASGTAPATPRTGDPSTQVPSPRGGDGAAAPQGGAPMGGGVPPQGGAPGGGGGGLGGGSPRAGGNAGWTGTPGSPGSHTPHAPDAPGRPRVGDSPDTPGRPRAGGGDTPRPRTPEPAARGFGPGTHGPDTHAPATRPGGPGHTGPGGTHGPDGAGPHEHGPGHHDPDGSPDGGAPHHGDEPLSPDEVNARHSESTPAGSSYHAGDPDMGDLPHRVQPDPDGRYTVDVHVTPDGHARIGDRLYTPEEFADVLRRNADYDGRPVRLIGCDASSNDFAHRLSRELDTEVMAPTKPAWTDAHGRVFSSDYEIGPDGKMRPRIPPDGEWNTHRPDGSTHAAGENGFAPDTRHHDPHDVDADSSRHRGDDDSTDWRDRPGPNGRPHSENIKDPKYIEDNYYKRVNADGSEELRRRPSVMNANPPHPELDLVDGEPAFKKDRPPAESLGFDEGRSDSFPPEREHGSAESTTDTGPGEDVPGEHAGTQNWREQDYQDIDEKIADREAKKATYDQTPADSDDWVGAHNAKNDASEALGEEASNHAVRDQLHRQFGEAYPGEDFDFRPHPDSAPGDQRFQLVDADGNVRAEITPRHPTDGGKPGNTNFDKIWEVDYKNGGDPHYIVHEAKGPGGGPSERYLPLEGRTVKQGHPDYFDDTLKNMRRDDKELAKALAQAKLDNRLDYVEVRARVDESVTPHANRGYDYKPYNGYDYESPLPKADPATPEE